MKKIQVENSPADTLTVLALGRLRAAKKQEKNGRGKKEYVIENLRETLNHTYCTAPKPFFLISFLLPLFYFIFSIVAFFLCQQDKPSGRLGYVKWTDTFDPAEWRTSYCERNLPSQAN
jgi:hypothetical protein